MADQPGNEVGIKEMLENIVSGFDAGCSLIYQFPLFNLAKKTLLIVKYRKNGIDRDAEDNTYALPAKFAIV